MNFVECGKISYLSIPFDICYENPANIIIMNDCEVFPIIPTYERCNAYLKVIIDLTAYPALDEGEWWINIYGNFPIIKDKIKIICNTCNE